MIKTVSIKSRTFLDSRLESAFKRWQQANATYLEARRVWDFARLANLKQETALWLAFASAKAAVKEATEAYYAVVAEISAAKQVVNVAKQKTRLAELEAQLQETQEQLLKTQKLVRK